MHQLKLFSNFFYIFSVYSKQSPLRNWLPYLNWIKVIKLGDCDLYGVSVDEFYDIDYASDDDSSSDDDE